jgi:pimeloyl-ACP methyl ester carboxylesterase
LLYLVEHPQRVVGKDELQDAIWAGTIVTETALTRAVMKARRAVGDDTEQPAVIQTVQRHGYRFIAAVEGPAPAAELPMGPIHFVQSGSAHIAWRSIGSGDGDLVIVPGFVSHLELMAELEEMRKLLARLGSRRRILLFDKRGMGLSERVGYAPTLEDTAEDIRCVMDAAGSRRAALLGISEGGPAALWFAHAHPGRVERLLIWGSMARGTRAPDYPWMPERERYERWLEEIAAGWGGPVGMEFFAPSAANDVRVREWWARLVRSATTPSGMRGVFAVLRDMDVRDLLPKIRVPTVILHRRDDRAVRLGAGRHLAESIPGATLSELPGSDHWIWTGSDPSDALLAALEPQGSGSRVAS